MSDVARDIRLVGNDKYAFLEDGTCWPTAGEANGNLERRLRGYAPLHESDHLVAASVLAAYRELVWTTGKRRAEVIAQLRRAAVKEREKETPKQQEKQ